MYGGPEPEHDIDFMPLPGGVPTAVLLVAGDFTRHGSVAEVAAGEFADLGIPVIAVLGNHDYHAGALPGGPGP